MMLTNDDYTVMTHLCLIALRQPNLLNSKQISEVETLLHKLITIKNKEVHNVVVRSKKVGKRARIRNS